MPYGPNSGAKASGSHTRCLSSPPSAPSPRRSRRLASPRGSPAVCPRSCRLGTGSISEWVVSVSKRPFPHGPASPSSASVSPLSVIAGGDFPVLWLGPMGKSSRPKPSRRGFSPARRNGLLAAASLQKPRRSGPPLALRPCGFRRSGPCPYPVRHRGEIGPGDEKGR
jgi:hypothetical protein